MTRAVTNTTYATDGGAAAGAILGLGDLRLISGMLFGSWSIVPVAAAAGLVLSAVTLVACALPALRATAVSPASALRWD